VIAMDLRVLGPVEASVGGRPLSLGAVKQRALLAMLGLQANRTVSADRLMEGLWGEHPPASAAKLVQQHVSRLRRLLADADDDAEIVTRGRGYELRVAPEAVDVCRFERLLADGAARGRSGCGAAHRWLMSRTSRSRRARSCGSRSCA
jgi:DNA-binding SARP family transcriptional activator